jgi:hypothetical protein
MSTYFLFKSSRHLSSLQYPNNHHRLRHFCLIHRYLLVYCMFCKDFSDLNAVDAQVRTYYELDLNQMLV